MPAVLSLAVLVAAVTACGAPASAAGGVPHPSSPAATGGPGAGRPCAARVVARESANGSAVCVTVGGGLIVLLPSGRGRGWSRPRVTGTGLGPARPVPTPAGLAGWSFRAVSAGRAVISTYLPLCPPAKPGGVSCDAMLGYRLRVTVR